MTIENQSLISWDVCNTNKDRNVKNTDQGYLWVTDRQLSPSNNNIIINNVCTTTNTLGRTALCKENCLTKTFDKIVTMVSNIF